MSKPRGREHTTLTETAAVVVRELYKVPNIKMIAPGEISTTNRRGGKRFVTFVHTTAGLELIITGQSVQKVAVHTDDTKQLIATLKNAKALREFTFSERSRKPGQ
jgi:hypothetical protein